MLKDLIKYKTKVTLLKVPRYGYSFFRYLKDFYRFRKRNKRFELNIRDWYPCLSDRLTYTPFDAHYTYHPAWAARIIAKTKPEKHIDFSSILYFGTMVSAFVPVEFYDYRPAHLKLDNYQSGSADLTKLSFPDNHFESVSCMHTVEHIGLGRYGDPIDPEGDIKAIQELKRITKRGGNLLFVTPVGKPKIEFNAHRIYSYEQVIALFDGFSVKEFSLIDDEGALLYHADPGMVKSLKYGCGCFWFTKA